MKIEELEQKLIGWRAARGIDENSTAEAQMACYEEERNELKDAIGDMIVTLINAEALGYDKLLISELIDELIEDCSYLSVDLEECMDMAWSEIEHRVGLVRKTGKFTKWKDLTHQERIKVALSGQLINAPQETVLGCQLLCTTQEWEEIRAAEQSIIED